MSRPFRVLSLLVALALVTAACGDDGGSSGPQVLAASDLARLDGEPAALPDAVEAAARFSADLYAELAAAEDGNLVFSPHSIAIALAMTRAGAAGVTAEEMDAVLHLAGAADPHGGFNALDQALATRSGTFTRGDGSEAEVVLRVANALWGQRDFAFEDTFLDVLAADYGAGMRLVDYVADVAAARVQINEWVAGQTEGRIEELVPQGALDEMTRLVLTNAVYLLAPWELPFDEQATSPGDFTLVDGSTVTADLMRQAGQFGYRRGDGWQAIELPYAGGELAMLVVVPDPGEYERVEATVADGLFSAAVPEPGTATVHLAFPRFEFRTEAGLADLLRSLGMETAFDPDLADFSAMSTADRLYVTDVIHEAFISVDEEGTEAAAATAVVMGVTSAPLDPVELTVDRPFLFEIRDIETGAPLFMGRVLDPTG